MEPLKRDRDYLHAHRILMRAGLSLVSAFGWIFVFEYALIYSGSYVDAFSASLLVYALSQVTVAILTPISASHLRHGVKRSLIFGVCLAALAYAVLGATLAGYFSVPLGWGMVFFGLLLGAYRALYWIPYRLRTANVGSIQSALFELLIALLPAFAGATLATVFLSPLRLLFGAAVLMMISAIAVLPLQDFGERFQWGYVETFYNLFDSRYRSLASRAVLSGIESTALFLIWPLSIFLIVGRSYLIFGFVMSASLLVLIAARSLYKGFVRSASSGHSMALDVAFSMSGWILRLAAGSPIAIVFADSYSYVSAPAGGPEYLSREHQSDAGSYLDEYTALQEIALSIGRIAMCVFAGCFLVALPMPLALAASLIVAAFAAGASAALSHTAKIQAY